jgi:hypothetical protein
MGRSDERVADDRRNDGVAETSPPKIPPALTLGVTGHRAEQLNGQSERIEAQLGDMIAAIQAQVDRSARADEAFFAPGAARLRMISPLAEGADQVAARVALRHGLALDAVLPFERSAYEQDFTTASARKGFDALIARAASVLQLPGDREAPLAAYVMAGRTTVAHCDLLIAIWDGGPSRGRGGTGEVVEIALLEGRPILHLPIDPAQPARLLWSGFDPHVCTTRENAHTAAVPFGNDALARVIEAVLLPPRDLRERGFITTFYRERDRRLNGRIEYPLLLALTGVSRLRRSAIRSPSLPATIAGEWQDFRAACAIGHGVTAAIDPLQRA